MEGFESRTLYGCRKTHPGFSIRDQGQGRLLRLRDRMCISVQVRVPSKGVASLAIHVSPNLGVFESPMRTYSFSRLGRVLWCGSLVLYLERLWTRPLDRRLKTYAKDRVRA